MPGQLRPDARCPICKRPLIALVDTTHGQQSPPVKLVQPKRNGEIPRGNHPHEV